MESPGYFSAMGIRVQAGRDLMHDHPMTGSDPVIVNRTLARTMYPDADPIGRPASTNGRALTIVGVVDDVRQASLDEVPVNQIYLGMAGVSARPALI